MLQLYYSFIITILTVFLGFDFSEPSENGQQSIKESTARNILAFTGCDISSINEHSSKDKDEQNSEDTGQENLFCSYSFYFSFCVLLIPDYIEIPD